VGCGARYCRDLSCARLGIGATLSEPTLPGARSEGPARPYVRGASLGGEGRMHVGHCAAGVPHVLLLPTGLYYSVWWAGRSAGLACRVGLLLL